MKAEADDCIRRQDAPASTRSAARENQRIDEHKSEPPALRPPPPPLRSTSHHPVAQPGKPTASMSISPSRPAPPALPVERPTPQVPTKTSNAFPAPSLKFNSHFNNTTNPRIA